MIATRSCGPRLSTYQWKSNLNRANICSCNVLFKWNPRPIAGGPLSQPVGREFLIVHAFYGGIRRPVSRVLSFADPKAQRKDDHSSGAPVTRRLMQPTRAAARKPAWPMARRPYAVLLPVGFTVPPPLPAARCALTAPFHPCPLAPKRNRRFAFCGTVPGVSPAGRYPAPCFRGARTFLSRAGRNPGESGHPAV